MGNGRRRRRRIAAHLRGLIGLKREPVPSERQAQPARIPTVKFEALPEREKFALLCAKFVPSDERLFRYEVALIEFDEFVRLPDLTQFAITKDTMYVGTRIIIAPDKDRIVREIGEFMLTISKDGITWENLTRTVEKYHAPYISFNQTLCSQWGHLQKIQMVLVEGKLLSAVRLMIDATKLGPGNGDGVTLDKWPKADPKIVRSRA